MNFWGKITWLRDKPVKMNSIPIVNPSCTEFEVNNWDLSKFIVEKLVPIVEVHPFPLNELMLMTGALCYVQPAHLFEWGTNIGKSARIFYETCEFFKLNTTIHSIDLPKNIEHAEHPGENRGILVKDFPEVKLYEGDGLVVASKICSSLHPKEPILFFLDGDHSYESVLRELQQIVVSFPTASVLIHDTFFQSEGSCYNVGPYNAIRTVMKSRKESYKILSTNTGLPGMTFIQPISL